MTRRPPSLAARLMARVWTDAWLQAPALRRLGPVERRRIAAEVQAARADALVVGFALGAVVGWVVGVLVAWGGA